MGCLDDYKPAMAMLGLQFTYAGVGLSTRAALLQGMSPRVFVVYRQAIATLVIAPIAYFTSVTINQNIYFEGVYLASSSMGSAMGNLAPAVTFVLASIIGLVGGIGVIFGLYVVLWGKAKDLEESNVKTDMNTQIDQTRIEQILIDESSEKMSSKIDLEQPLLSDRSK
ncbi:hypothetical protein F0562_009230 [Nyssa sinensis]|uniref:WAT1-related protein n=1 Tax=Nyssa sinensis TaxID=561372 RepID=A0A5J5A0C7_9ASTE|nr:hypothetical protein F0562_009230 [Nyssa sinensis]